MSEDNQITYDELAAVAERLSHEGRKVTLEYVRRELGKGTHAQIAVLLGKWQKENAQLVHENKNVNPRFSQSKSDDTRMKSGATSLRRPDMGGFKSKKPARYQQQSAHSQSESRRAYSRTQFIGNGNSDESYEAIAPRESLTPERLKSEPAIIQKLFQALAIIRSTRLLAQEHYQTAQNELLNTRMACDQEVREFQKTANEQLLALQTEFSRLKTTYDQEVIAIRRQLSI
ncbi:DNA-binding protein [Cysteiniphilum halobium]|uniref:DNA-binding protein n=1 Tax=Cysteiniphilum halobium TaxID=2219059 RepID=UPI000E64E9D5|nr:DNA-binding protein [Cysteiniphilum halobium]